MCRKSAKAPRVHARPARALIARFAADVVEFSGYFKQASATDWFRRFIHCRDPFSGKEMISNGITAHFALGGITSSIVELHEKGLIDVLVDTQSFDSVARSRWGNRSSIWKFQPNEYCQPSSKGAFCDQLDVAILSAARD